MDNLTLRLLGLFLAQWCRGRPCYHRSCITSELLPNSFSPHPLCIPMAIQRVSPFGLGVYSCRTARYYHGQY
ncbi:hypothetical protein B0H16DRAFT_1626594 [Mycena metata]|uniref:Secreted protein n=1 Tax=Mycena metata TaxID=1033252 RepID=A0AAD7H4W9_9AGAR|nr:hypothetical protein B0H16DRAFT_1626594 [Mycena metata]